MARGRKSAHVKTLTHRDIKLIQQLAKTGLSNQQQAATFCNLNADRLQKLEKSGFIKTSKHAVHGANNLILQLGSKGKSFCKQELGIDSFCRSQTNHLEHDLKLTEAYYSLEPHVQETWVHEVDLINEIYEKKPEMIGKLENCVDATVMINGERVAIESIGRSYKDSDVQYKQQVAGWLGCSSFNGF